MMERLERLDKIASELPKRSLEEALAGYRKLERLAAEPEIPGQNENILRRPNCREDGEKKGTLGTKLSRVTR